MDGGKCRVGNTGSLAQLVRSFCRWARLTCRPVRNSRTCGVNYLDEAGRARSSSAQDAGRLAVRVQMRRYSWTTVQSRGRDQRQAPGSRAVGILRGASRAGAALSARRNRYPGKEGHFPRIPFIGSWYPWFSERLSGPLLVLTVATLVRPGHGVQPSLGNKAPAGYTNAIRALLHPN